MSQLYRDTIGTFVLVGNSPMRLVVCTEGTATQGSTDRVVLEQLGQSAQLEKLMTLIGRVVA